MQTVEIINAAIVCLFFICYSYQFVYMAISLFHREKPHKAPEKLHRIAVLIAAKNEQDVIGNLIDSIKAQDYPSEYVDIYVGADNCTDNTVKEAKEHGAVVFEQKRIHGIGKGYVLNCMLGRIKENMHKSYDAYIVLDADNVLEPDFISEINKTFSDGYEIVTCYRNSKNYGDNWISAGYGLWFLRESRYINAARMAAGTSCAVSGTGFLFSDNILNTCGGWNFYLLTEDIEFTIDNVVRGEKIGYAPKAILYDEQPTDFERSWHQRIRWSKGYLQVFKKYGKSLINGIFHGSFACYDMTMNIMPAAVLTGIGAVMNVGAAGYRFACGGSLASLGWSVLQTVISLCLTLLMVGAVTTLTEWRKIYCPAWKKILYIFTFPIFMLTYIPVCIASFFTKPDWKPIRHDQSLTLEQIMKNGEEQAQHRHIRRWYETVARPWRKAC